MPRFLLLALAALLAAPSASAQADRCDIDGRGVITQSTIRASPGDTFRIGYVFGIDGGCPAFDVAFYISTDDDLSTDDLLVGTATLPASGPQTNVSGSGEVTVPELGRGGYSILVVADPEDAIPEDGQGNNINFGKLTVGGDLSGPNLVIVSASLEDATAAPGGRVSFDYAVNNRGQSDVGDVTIGFYLVRRNTGPPSQITPLGSEVVGNVEAGETEDESEQITLPSNLEPGQYNFLVEADFGNAVEESDETDNIASAGILTVTGATAGEATPGASALSLAASPNPVGGSVRLSYTLTEASPVRLVVSDALGRTVAVVEGARGAGTHAEALDTARWAPGVYVARLAVGGEAAVQTLTVAR